jgi:uncharacterized membrane protein
MIDLGQFVKFLHIASSFLLVTGLLGRELTRMQAARTADIQIFSAFTQLAGRFESLLVIPGSFLVLLFGMLIGWMRGWPLLGFLTGSSSNWLLVSLLLYLGMIPLIVFVFLPRGKVFEARLADAQARGQVTPELLASLHDPAVRRAHIAEAAGLVIITYLMVMKPF